MTTTLSPAQQTQIDNRDATGQWKQKAHGEVDEDADILGIDDSEEEAVDEPAVDPPVRYSFLKEFELAEEKFNTDFEGIPNRFYNADLRGKYLNRVADDDLELFADALADPDSRAGRYFDNRGLSGRLCHAVSSPEDNKVDDQTAVEMIENLDHVTEVHTIEKDSLLATMGKNASRGWLAKMETVNADGEREQRWLAVLRRLPQPAENVHTALRQRTRPSPPAGHSDRHPLPGRGRTPLPSDRGEPAGAHRTAPPQRGQHQRLPRRLPPGVQPRRLPATHLRLEGRRHLNERGAQSPHRTRRKAVCGQ